MTDSYLRQGDNSDLLADAINADYAKLRSQLATATAALAEMTNDNQRHLVQAGVWSARAGLIQGKLDKAEAALAEAKKALVCPHELATQRFHFYQEGRAGMSWWCTNCGALFLHDDVKLPTALASLRKETETSAS